MSAFMSGTEPESGNSPPLAELFVKSETARARIQNFDDYMKSESFFFFFFFSKWVCSLTLPLHLNSGLSNHSKSFEYRKESIAKLISEFCAKSASVDIQ